MRHLSRILSISLALLFCFATNGQATTKTFPAGTYIIPMDSVNQPSADQGIFEAYGLVFDLLENGYVVYWMIDDTKTAIGAPDFSVDGAGAVPVTALNGAVNGPIVNSIIQYSGAPFVVEPQPNVTQVLNHADWSAVDIHMTNVPFTASVARKLEGAPPQVALLNNDETLTSGSGNAAILESYLMLAGICPSAYDIVTPNMVRDGILQGTPVSFNGTTYQKDYNILWTPHFTAYDLASPKDPSYASLNNIETMVQNVRTFLEAGNALFAECASISVFEHSPNGHFLTTTGIHHDGGTMDPAKMIYAGTTSPFPQTGGGGFNYSPVGGHLHNWQPWLASTQVESYTVPKDGGKNAPELYPFALPQSMGKSGMEIPNGLPTVDSKYNPTVTRFTYDDWDGNPATTTDQWDYYVGGRIDGDASMGYVVYLGGHEYTTGCTASGSSTGGSGGSGPKRDWDFKFKKNLSNETFTFDITYTPAGGARQTITLPGGITSASHAVTAGTDLVVDFTPAIFSSKNIKNISVSNTSSVDITVDSVTVSWTNGNSSQKNDQLDDTVDGITLYKKAKASSGATVNLTNAGSGAYVIGAGVVTAPGGGSTTIGGCVNTSACTDAWLKKDKNTGAMVDLTGGIRYVLNTLFNLQFAVVDTTYTRSSPIVMGNYMYEGAFATPSYKGHMYIYDITTGPPPTMVAELWARDQMPANRTMYTTPDGTANSQILFNTGNTGSFAASLNIANATYATNPTAFTDHVTRVRGEGLMAVEHSAAAVVMPSSRNSKIINGQVPSRTMLYFGTLGGELEAFDVSSLYGGTGSITELWSFIPNGQLGALQNQRNMKPPASPNPGVDGSPTVAEVYVPGATPTVPGAWKTYLSVLPGAYGAKSTVLVLDITDPANPKVMFEKQGKDPATGAVTMNEGYRSAIGTIKDAAGNKTNVVFVVTNKILTQSPPNKGGLRVFAFNIADGTQMWDRVFDYTSTQNDIPGAITLLDDTKDSYVDKVIIGDMEGKIWVLDAANGSIHGPPSNPTGPLYDAGIGYPIAASPTVVYDNVHNRYVVVFGTGGTSWALDANTYSIIAVDMGTGGQLWKNDLLAGEKAWGSPTVSNGYVYVNTAFGNMESPDPGTINPTGLGKLRTINLDGGKMTSVTTGNQRGSVYIKGGKAYVTAIDSQVFVKNVKAPGTPISVETVSWGQN